MITTLADPYLALNAERRYPLADDTSGMANSSILEVRITTGIPQDGYPISPAITDISTVSVSSRTYKRITVTLYRNGTAVDMLKFDVPSTLASYGYHTVLASSASSSGAMTVTASILSEPKVSSAIPLAPTTVVCRSLTVDSVQGVGAADFPQSAVLTGDIVLDPGRNADPYLDGQRIRLDIAPGAGIGERCQEASAGQTCGNVLFTINGERPGSDGDIRIAGEGGITVTPVADNNMIIISIDSAASDKMSVSCERTC